MNPYALLPWLAVLQYCPRPGVAQGGLPRQPPISALGLVIRRLVGLPESSFENLFGVF